MIERQQIGGPEQQASGGLGARKNHCSTLITHLVGGKRAARFRIACCDQKIEQVAMIGTERRGAPSSDDRIDSRDPAFFEGTPPSEREGKGCFGGRKRIQEIGSSGPGEIWGD